MNKHLMLCAFFTVFTIIESNKSAAFETNKNQLPSLVKEIFRKRCLECHGGDSINAGLSILDLGSMLEKKMIIPGSPDESKIYSAVVSLDEDVRMPAGQDALTATEVETIRLWIKHGAGEFPADVPIPSTSKTDTGLLRFTGVDYVLNKIRDHVSQLPPTARSTVRYFSCNHLLTRGATATEISTQRDALVKALNHLSREQQIVTLETVDPEIGTIFALDLRKIGWHKQLFKELHGNEFRQSKLNIFDLILLDYPYGISYQDSTTYAQLAVEYLTPSGMIRPIPYIRSDWFCSVVTQPPLYHDILQLPHNLSGLEKELGIDSALNISQAMVKRAGMAVSGVSRNNRAVERHVGGERMYWKSIDYSNSRGSSNLFSDPLGLEAGAAGGEMIFSLPNGLQGYYIANAKGDRLDFAPTEIVTDKFSADKTVRNGLHCMRCHDQGIKDFVDNVRPAIESAFGGILNKREVLRIYPPQAEMGQILETDRQRFMSAMESALGHPQSHEPLIPVSKRFLDDPISFSTVIGELGLSDGDELKTLFKQPNFASFGLISLSQRGVVRRDTWEDYFDQVVRNMGIGIPIVPIDGLIRDQYKLNSSSHSLELKTNHSNNVFKPGDTISIIARNNSSKTIYIELIGTSIKGEKVVLVSPSMSIPPGGSIHFPENGVALVRPSLGRETITAFYSDKPFKSGMILRGANMADRFIHPVYDFTEGTNRLTNSKDFINDDVSNLVKQTIIIETR